MRARVGVIGGGTWGRHHLAAARDLHRDGVIELCAVAARTHTTADAQSKIFGIVGYTDFRRMIEEEELDAVTIATPDHLHREVTLDALQRKCHVLVEKPMDTTIEGCTEMLAAAEEADRLLQVDFHKRYDLPNIDARRRIQSDELGQPLYGYAYMEDKIIIPAEQLAGWAAETSPFWFIGVHQFDLLRWITGREANSVLAHGQREKLPSLGIDTWDAVTAHIQMDGGFTATVQASWVLPRGFDSLVNQGVRVVCTEGLVEIDAQDRGLRYCTSEGGLTTANVYSAFDEERGAGRSVARGYFLDAVKDFYRNVAHLHAGGSRADLVGSYPDAFDGLRATELCQAVHASIAAGKPVAVERTNVTKDAL